MEEKKQSNLNYQMCILSAIGICFVLLGHLQSSRAFPFTFCGWFPYYSFHMPLFLFITGYFYREESGPFLASFARFVWKKCRKLLIPYYVINGAFILAGILTGVQIHHYSFTEYLLMPWTKYQPLTLAIPTWYLAGLFLAEIYYDVLHRVLSFLCRKETLRDILLLLVILALSSASCYMKATYPVNEAAGVYLRSVVMLFFIHIGYLYRKYLERLDTLPGTTYFVIVFLLQFLMIWITRDSLLSPGLYDMSGFGRTGLVYYCAGITGIALWLRISRLLSQIPVKSRLLIFIGSNTKYIMSFHLSGYFLLNMLFYVFYEHGWFTEFLTGYDPAAFASKVVYYNITGTSPLSLVLYFLAGMLISLLLAQLIRFIKARIDLLSERHRTNP